MSAMPINRNPVANDTIRKYLNAASLEEIFSFLLPANTYNEMERISMPRNNIAILLNEANTMAPTITNKTNAAWSVICVSLWKYERDIQNQNTADVQIKIVKASAKLSNTTMSLK